MKHEPEEPQEVIMPWESENWSENRRRRAKGTLYQIAEQLDTEGATEDEVCRFLALYGQQIGDPDITYGQWENRAYQWAERHSPKKVTEP